eukprot:TRINITY_DN1068_c0_g2_i3.p1 TRINITY_DN1068_c0_g2~~TRINITY_DN1068_c0_g2_i3.p1  ORF type:complete len:819 (+),score=133.57 TRINITY_DN1068_c0_g2_i3:407-2863(+)
MQPGQGFVNSTYEAGGGLGAGGLNHQSQHRMADTSGELPSWRNGSESLEYLPPKSLPWESALAVANLLVPSPQGARKGAGGGNYGGIPVPPLGSKDNAVRSGQAATAEIGNLSAKPGEGETARTGGEPAAVAAAVPNAAVAAGGRMADHFTRLTRISSREVDRGRPRLSKEVTFGSGAWKDIQALDVDLSLNASQQADPATSLMHAESYSISDLLVGTGFDFETDTEPGSGEVDFCPAFETLPEDDFLLPTGGGPSLLATSSSLPKELDQQQSEQPSQHPSQQYSLDPSQQHNQQYSQNPSQQHSEQYNQHPSQQQAQQEAPQPSQRHNQFALSNGAAPFIGQEELSLQGASLNDAAPFLEQEEISLRGGKAFTPAFPFSRSTPPPVRVSSEGATLGSAEAVHKLESCNSLPRIRIGGSRSVSQMVEPVQQQPRQAFSQSQSEVSDKNAVQLANTQNAAWEKEVLEVFDACRTLPTADLADPGLELVIPDYKREGHTSTNTPTGSPHVSRPNTPTKRRRQPTESESGSMSGRGQSNSCESAPSSHGPGVNTGLGVEVMQQLTGDGGYGIALPALEIHDGVPIKVARSPGHSPRSSMVKGPLLEFHDGAATKAQRSPGHSPRSSMAKGIPWNEMAPSDWLWQDTRESSLTTASGAGSGSGLGLGSGMGTSLGTGIGMGVGTGTRIGRGTEPGEENLVSRGAWQPSINRLIDVSPESLLPHEEPKDRGAAAAADAILRKSVQTIAARFELLQQANSKRAMGEWRTDDERLRADQQQTGHQARLLRVASLQDEAMVAWGDRLAAIADEAELLLQRELHVVH